MKSTEIEIFAILLLILTLIPGYLQIIIPQACIEFSATQCTRCLRSTHLYDGLCYENILGCQEYKEGDLCVRCQVGNFQLRSGGCRLVAGISLLTTSLDKYNGEGGDNPGDQYGESNFIPSTYEQVKNWQTFITLDNFVRKGQYSHYISRMSNPVFSVHYYQQANTYSYKTLYFGSGGGLFLCIADISPKMQVSLRTLTPISASSIIYNCIDYDVSGRCLSCKSGNHLQGAKCYSNYGGCMRYYENLCIQCMEFYLLVENRCVSDCYSVADVRSMLFYQGNQVNSTMEVYYGVSISMFYTITNVLTQNINFVSTSSTNTTITTKNNDGKSGDVISATSKINQYLSTKDNASPTNNQASIISPQASASASSGSSSSPTASADSSSSSSFNIGSTGQILQRALSSASTPTQYQSSYTVVAQQLPPTITMPSLREYDYLNKTQQIKNNPQLTNTIVFPIKRLDSSNEHCVTLKDKVCLKCVQYYFVNQLGVCQELSPLCVSVDASTGYCQKCFNGYVINKGRCNFKLFS